MAANESPEDRKLRLEAELLAMEIADRKAEAELREVTWKRQMAEEEQELQAARYRSVIADLDHKRYLRGLHIQNAKENFRVLYFEDTVDDATVADARGTLRYWTMQDEADDVKRPILIKFKSPGGSVIDGLDFYDYIMDLRAQGWQIDTRATGIAASMAGVLLQAGEERQITHHSTLHLHEVSSLYLGKMSDVADNVNFSKTLQKKLCDIYASRSRLSSRQVHNLMERKEVFLSAEEALAKGFVDRIV